METKSINIIEEYSKYCADKNIPFTIESSVRPYDDSTLFCPAGMQQFKSKFKDTSYKGTIANIQPCIRMNDFEEIGDSSHLLYFNMIGLFSFRDMYLFDAIKFWIEFIKILGVKLDYVTIHPDKLTASEDWDLLYDNYNVEVKPDPECYWSDGEIGGYCTEFYSKGIEIGNIVNPLGNCIDVGFGLERLNLVLGNPIPTKQDILKDTITKIIDSGYSPSNTKQGYVLRKLLRELYKLGSSIDHKYFKDEVTRQENILLRYNNLKDKHKDKSEEWWYDTHGINLKDLWK